MGKKTNNVYQACFLALAVIALVLEILPFSVRLNFSTETGAVSEYYSYFSVTPFGFGVFLTFPVALLTCAMIVAGTASFFWRKKTLEAIVCILSLATAVLAFLSFVFSFSAVSFIGLGLFLLTAGAFALSFFNAGAVKALAYGHTENGQS